MKDSAIGWCDDTVNFWWGCVEQRFDESNEMRPECAPCYARETDRRYGPSFDGHRHWGAGGYRWIRTEAALKELWRDEKVARQTGKWRRQFINSMSDFFEDREDLDEARYHALNAFRKVEHLDIMLLTKRPGDFHEIMLRVYKFALDQGHEEALDTAVWIHEWLHVEGKEPKHIWVGITAGVQRAADQDIPRLCAIPAAVRFVSVEPMYEYVDLANPFNGLYPLSNKFIHWVIAGGQSGQKRKELDLFALAKLADVCRANQVALFVKQDSHLLPGQQGRIPEALWKMKQFPK